MTESETNNMSAIWQECWEWHNKYERLKHILYATWSGTALVAVVILTSIVLGYLHD